MIGVVSLSQGVQCWLRLLGDTQNNDHGAAQALALESTLKVTHSFHAFISLCICMHV